MHDYYDLGSHSMPVTTDVADAQTWFNRGLLWTYGFNHEALRGELKVGAPWSHRRAIPGEHPGSVI